MVNPPKRPGFVLNAPVTKSIVLMVGLASVVSIHRSFKPLAASDATKYNFQPTTTKPRPPEKLPPASEPLGPLTNSTVFTTGQASIPQNRPRIDSNSPRHLSRHRTPIPASFAETPTLEFWLAGLTHGLGQRWRITDNQCGIRWADVIRLAILSSQIKNLLVR